MSKFVRNTALLLMLVAVAQTVHASDRYRVDVREHSWYPGHRTYDIEVEREPRFGITDSLRIAKPRPLEKPALDAETFRKLLFSQSQPKCNSSGQVQQLKNAFMSEWHKYEANRAEMERTHKAKVKAYNKQINQLNQQLAVTYYRNRQEATQEMIEAVEQGDKVSALMLADALATGNDAEIGKARLSAITLKVTRAAKLQRSIAKTMGIDHRAASRVVKKIMKYKQLHGISTGKAIAMYLRNDRKMSAGRARLVMSNLDY